MRKLVVALALVLVAASSVSAGEDNKEHKIHGKDYDKYAVEQLLDESSVPAVVYVDKVISKLTGKFPLDRDMPVEEAALDFIDKNKNAFGLKEPKKELKQKTEDIHPNGNITLNFQQTFNDVPIWGRSINVDLTKEYDIYVITGGYGPTPDIDTTPLVTVEEAIDIASIDRQASQPGDISETITKLFIYYKIRKGPRLVYVVTFLQNFHSWAYFIDARTGEIIKKDNVDNYDSAVDSGGRVGMARRKVLHTFL